MAVPVRPDPVLTTLIHPFVTPKIRYRCEFRVFLSTLPFLKNNLRHFDASACDSMLVWRWRRGGAGSVAARVRALYYDIGSHTTSAAAVPRSSCPAGVARQWQCQCQHHGPSASIPTARDEGSPGGTLQMSERNATDPFLSTGVVPAALWHVSWLGMT